MHRDQQQAELEREKAALERLRDALEALKQQQAGLEVRAEEPGKA